MRMIQQTFEGYCMKLNFLILYPKLFLSLAFFGCRIVIRHVVGKWFYRCAKCHCDLCGCQSHNCFENLLDCYENVADCVEDIIVKNF